MQKCDKKFSKISKEQDSMTKLKVPIPYKWTQNLNKFQSLIAGSKLSERLLGSVVVCFKVSIPYR